jgi:hypothetical protein
MFKVLFIWLIFRLTLLDCGVCLSGDPQISNQNASAENQLAWRKMKYFLSYYMQFCWVSLQAT